MYQAFYFGRDSPSSPNHFYKHKQNAPAIKCGPGLSERSHTPDEFVLEEEVLAGARFYTRLIGMYSELRAELRAGVMTEAMEAR